VTFSAALLLSAAALISEGAFISMVVVRQSGGEARTCHFTAIG